MSTFRRRLLANQAQRAARGDLIYPGLVAAWSAKGKTNEDEDRKILKDLTGHGHDITLNNFAFNRMSGYGGYKVTTEDFTKSDVTLDVSLTKCYTRKRHLYNATSILYGKIDRLGEYLVRITGLLEGDRLEYCLGDPQPSELSIYSDGVYTVSDTNRYDTGSIGFKLYGDTSIDTLVCIEFVPEYPDALVFDGVDDYGVCNNMPILNDYTVIVNRTLLSILDEDYGVVLSNVNGVELGANELYRDLYGLFAFEQLYTWGYKIETRTFGLLTAIDKLFIPLKISWQTKSSYNLQILSNSNPTQPGYNVITLGARRLDRHCNFIFYSAYLFDHSLPETEIKSFIRLYIDPLYLLPSEIPTPDCYYDFSLGSNDDENRETIVDLSGNGNDAKAYNFSWSGMSGYNGYPVNFEEFKISDLNGEPETYSKTKTKITFLNSSDKLLNILKLVYNPPLGSIILNLYTINITGLPDTQSIVYEWRDGVDFGNYHTMNLVNGINTIPKIEATILTELQKYISVFEYKTKSIVGYEITIELLPEYPGALVLDGVDDYINLEAFDSGFKTIFMLCNSFLMDKILYDLRNSLRFAIFHSSSNYELYGSGKAAYYGRADETCNIYLNGILNDRINGILPTDTINKKHLITVTTEGEVNQIYGKIGTNVQNNSYFANMAIYKFLGFKEALNEDLILYVINKYNLLEGVDDLESSEI